MRFTIYDSRFTRGLLAAAGVALALVARAQETNGVHAIDLATALRLAGANNLDVRIARERLAEARANQESATWQFFPWLAPGFAFRAHDHAVQNTEGDVIGVHRDSYTLGPALVAQVDVGDAIYKRLAARQQEASFYANVPLLARPPDRRTVPAQ